MHAPIVTNEGVNARVKARKMKFVKCDHTSYTKVAVGD